MAAKFRLDKGILRKYAQKQFEKYPKQFKIVSTLRILFTWRDKPKKDAEGYTVVAQAIRLGPKWRDILEKDVEIEVCRSLWKSMTGQQRRRVIYHELSHILPVVKNGKLKKDGAGRVQVSLRKHDIVVKTFANEVKKFGPEQHDENIAKFVLSSAARRKGARAE